MGETICRFVVSPQLTSCPIDLFFCLFFFSWLNDYAPLSFCGCLSDQFDVFYGISLAWMYAYHIYNAVTNFQNHLIHVVTILSFPLMGKHFVWFAYFVVRTVIFVNQDAEQLFPFGVFVGPNAKIVEI